MALTFVIEQKTVTWKNGKGDTNSLTVRGLSLMDTSHLMQTVKPQLEAAVTQLKAAAPGGKLGDVDLSAVASQIVSTYPELVARVIALVSDHPDDWPAMTLLPLPVTVDLVMAIGAMTFTEEGSVKKFIEHLTALVRQMTSNLSSPPGAIQ